MNHPNLKRFSAAVLELHDCASPSDLRAHAGTGHGGASRRRHARLRLDRPKGSDARRRVIRAIPARSDARPAGAPFSRASAARTRHKGIAQWPSGGPLVGYDDAAAVSTDRALSRLLLPHGDTPSTWPRSAHEPARSLEPHVQPKPEGFPAGRRGESSTFSHGTSAVRSGE